METFRLEIVNPKAKRLLKDLEDLNFITINKVKDFKSEYKNLLSKLRSDEVPTLEEITREVETVRALRCEN